MTTERRRYFRIEERALIKYRVIQEDMLDEERKFIFLNEIKVENLHAALLGIDLRLQDLVAAIRRENKLAAEAIDLINRKLTLIERVVSLESSLAGGSEYREHQPTQVNLSGGGVALNAVTPLALNAWLAIDLVLLPTNHPMRVIGRVVDCRQNEDGGFAIAIEFEEIKEEDRDILVQHIVRRQSRRLRQGREEAEDAA
jgi:hypothetical protein